jgi:glycosyltransferase A (GT-A) superfamily protein (DUF2064 family)
VVRYTVHDRDKTVSFTGDPELARALTAACAAEPPLLEHLLLATEGYRPGVVRTVMHALLEADTAAEMGRALPQQTVFEVVDEATRANAATPEADGLMEIDLAERRLAAHGLDTPLRSRGTVRTVQVGSNLERETVYALGASWSVSEEALVTAGAR